MHRNALYYAYEERRPRRYESPPMSYRPFYGGRYEYNHRISSRHYGKPSGFDRRFNRDDYHTKRPRDSYHAKEDKKELVTPKKYEDDIQNHSGNPKKKTKLEKEDAKPPQAPKKKPTGEKNETDDEEESNSNDKKEKAYKKEIFRLKDSISNLKRKTELRDRTVQINNDLIAKNKKLIEEKNELSDLLAGQKITKCDGSKGMCNEIVKKLKEENARLRTERNNAQNKYKSVKKRIEKLANRATEHEEKLNATIKDLEDKNGNLSYKLQLYYDKFENFDQNMRNKIEELGITPSQLADSESQTDASSPISEESKDQSDDLNSQSENSSSQHDESNSQTENSNSQPSKSNSQNDDLNPQNDGSNPQNDNSQPVHSKLQMVNDTEIESEYLLDNKLKTPGKENADHLCNESDNYKQSDLEVSDNDGKLSQSEASSDTNSNSMASSDKTKAAKVSAQYESLDDIFFNTDDEFEDDIFYVGKYEVKNFSNPKDSLSKNVKVPKDIKTSKFKPTPVSLNNKVVFVATGSMMVCHKGDKRGCSLGPCRIVWNKGDKIAKVRILIGLPAQVNQEVWVCHHHQQASLKGFTLQKQILSYKKADSKEPMEKAQDLKK